MCLLTESCKFWLFMKYRKYNNNGRDDLAWLGLAWPANLN